MARHYPSVLRARQDSKEGLLWKARDRLHGVVKAAPADQETLELLGSVDHEMGDLPNAGRFWYLTERTGPEVEAAQAALHQRYPFPELLRHVPARAPAEQYPPQVQVRLEELEARAASHGVAWKTGHVTAPAPERTAGQSTGDTLMLGAFLVLGPGVWLVGVATVIYWFAS